MERRHTLLIAALATAALTVSGAFAQDYGPWSATRMGPGMMYGNGRAAIIDQNDDGPPKRRIISKQPIRTATDR